MDEVTANLSEHQEQTEQSTEQATAQTVEQSTPSTEISDEQFQAYLKNKLNFEGGLDNLRQKLEYTPPKPEPSDEEKTAQERAEDKRLLDVFVKNGGTIEQFSALKGLTKEDDLELGRKAALKELIEEGGFTKEKAEAELKVRYSLKELSELSEDDFDTTEEFEEAKAELQKKIDFGIKKLSKKSQFIKKQAEEVFTGLKNVIANEDLRVQQETAFSSKVDEFVSTLPRKMTLQLGESDGRKLDPIAYDVSENAIAEVAQTLKDKSKRDEYLFDQEGNVNISTVAELMLRNKILESAVKASYLTGETRQSELFYSVYGGRTPQQIGVGGAPQKRATEVGRPIRKGAPQVANFQTN